MLTGTGIWDWGLVPKRVVRVSLIALALIAPLAPLAPLESLPSAFAQPSPPELTRPVNDFANVIDPAVESELERRILALKQASGDIVIVATIETFEPYADIREYAVRMFENRGRGIGEKGKDNGLLVLLAVKNRRVWVEVGYDLEQFVTDGFAGEVSRDDMAPHFKQGEYGEGVLAGATRLISRIAEGRGVRLEGIPQVARRRSQGIEISPWVILLAIVVIILMSNILSNSAGPRSRMRRRTHWGGGPWSGWDSGVGPFSGGGGIGGGGFGGGFGGFGGGRSGGGGGGAGW
jgi:uncharacterized protein